MKPRAMKPAELDRALRRYARDRGLDYWSKSNTGGGSHRVVSVGARKAVLPWHAGRDLKTGTLRGILRTLGIDPADL